MSTHLLIIDPQVDFCDPARGSLYVPGADKDIERLAAFVRATGERLDAIHVTLDSHHVYDIAHPVFWRDDRGAHPAPFSAISADDVAARCWYPTNPDLFERALAYARALETGGRYTLTIWPYHCLIGSEGHAISGPLFESLKNWEMSGRLVDYIHKGENPYTEHYSAIKAEVPDREDLNTQPNRRLLTALREADTVIVAGEAASHCVANTVRDIADDFGTAKAIGKLVLLTDATCSVPGFEQYGERFVEELTQRGMRTATTTDW